MKSWISMRRTSACSVQDDFQGYRPGKAPLFQSPQKLFGVHGSAGVGRRASPSATDCQEPVSLGSGDRIHSVRPGHRPVCRVWVMTTGRPLFQRHAGASGLLGP